MSQSPVGVSELPLWLKNKGDGKSTIGREDVSKNEEAMRRASCLFRSLWLRYKFRRIVRRGMSRILRPVVLTLGEIRNLPQSLSPPNSETFLHISVVRKPFGPLMYEYTVPATDHIDGTVFFDRKIVVPGVSSDCEIVLTVYSRLPPYLAKRLDVTCTSMNVFRGQLRYDFKDFRDCDFILADAYCHVAFAYTQEINVPLWMGDTFRSPWYATHPTDDTKIEAAPYREMASSWYKAADDRSALMCSFSLRQISLLLHKSKCGFLRSPDLVAMLEGGPGELLGSSASLPARGFESRSKAHLLRKMASHSCVTTEAPATSKPPLRRSKSYTSYVQETLSKFKDKGIAAHVLNMRKRLTSSRRGSPQSSSSDDGDEMKGGGVAAQQTSSSGYGPKLPEERFWCAIIGHKLLCYQHPQYEEPALVLRLDNNLSIKRSRDREGEYLSMAEGYTAVITFRGNSKAEMDSWLVAVTTGMGSSHFDLGRLT